MGKKSKRHRTKQGSAAKDDDARPAPSLRGKASAEESKETLDNLQFEDPYVDEYEDDDNGEWEDVNDEEGVKEASADGEGTQMVQSWNPLTGESLRPGEKLEMDPSAYKMHHAMSAEWPSLTFDFVRDEWGESRTRFPLSLMAVVGTQADAPDQNKVIVIKLSELARMPVESEDDILGDEFNPDHEDDESEDDSDDEISVDPILENYSIPHYGGVNRLRVMPQHSKVVATWSDCGHVNVYHIEGILQRLSATEGRAEYLDIPSRPFFTYKGHKTEGYAMDWSSRQVGSLVTGDCQGSIHLWHTSPDGTYSAKQFYENHAVDAGSPSVEDLQWSPAEETVFASAECCGYVRVFDTRAPNKAMLSHKIHSSGADVNVLSWNRLVSNLLATGGDNGVLSVWDLRHFSGSKLEPLARFTPHKTAITSVEWHPTDESMLAASDDTGTYIYDLSVEEDDTAGQTDVPPQLLFVHCGSEQYKEVHWHPQIVSCLMTTALSGYSVFIPSNL